MNIAKILIFAWNMSPRMPRLCLMGVLALGLSAVTFATAFAAERGRVRVQNGTVMSDRNTILRGASMAVMYGPGNSNNSSYWRHLNVNLALNAVRLGVKTGQIGRTVEQQLPALSHQFSGATVLYKGEISSGCQTSTPTSSRRGVDGSWQDYSETNKRGAV